MRALVGLLSFSLLLATGTCLECESCSAFKEDCTGQLELCGPDQDTCATILTETKVGKVTSFTTIKSCYQSSKCLGSSKENSFIKLNVKVECSSSPAGKMKREGSKALDNWSNELPENRLLFSRPKSRAAELLDRLVDPSSKPSNPPVDPSAKPSNPPVDPSPKPSNPPVDPSPKPSNPSVDPSPKPSNPSVDPSTKPSNPSVDPSPKPSNPSVDPSPKPSNPPVDPSTKPPNPPKPSEKPTEATTPDNAQQMAASFLLALSSLLFMKILL